MSNIDQDKIIEVGIDENECLYVKPKVSKFPYIYREAVEVKWEAGKNVLIGSKPRKWSYSDWFIHILSSAELQSVVLILSSETRWSNIDKQLKEEILERYNEKYT